MAETTVVTSSDPEPAGGDVAGVVAGAAAVEAQGAAADAAEAQAAADAAAAEASAAEGEANAAYAAAMAADARTLDLAGKMDAMATLQLAEAQRRAAAAEAADNAHATTPEGEGGGKAKDLPPKDLEKKGKRKTLRQWYEGG
jgi:hypothetical protein